jgi:hypothetical protein
LHEARAKLSKQLKANEIQVLSQSCGGAAQVYSAQRNENAAEDHKVRIVQ